MSAGESSTGLIGVGMGGSCPECRSPVDLGQEFCLECGAPVRITRKLAKGKQGTRASAGTSMRARPAKRSFPWVPFLAVLGLVTLGVVFAFVDGGEKKSSGNTETSTAGLTDLDNESSTPDTLPSVPTDTATTDCIDTTTTPTDPTGTSIPTVPAVGAATDPTATTNCVDTTTTATTPGLTDATSTSTASTAGSSTDSSLETWPAGESGYTIVIASYAKNVYSQDDAEERAVEAQQQGLTAGVLDSDSFPSLTANLWVVFSGQFDSRDDAEDGLPKVQQAGYQGAYVREVSTS